MRIIVTGRTGCGKTTFIDQINQEVSGPILSKSASSALVDHTKSSIVEVKLKDIAKHYQPEAQIVIINSAAILCCIRSELTFSIKNANSENDYLKYVTELPNCTIINNNDSIDALRVQVKKYIKKYL